MPSNDEYQVTNIFDYLDTESLEVILNDISSFKSSRNDDVENFLKNNAVNFCRLKQAITYLLYNKSGVLSAYFTLAFKIVDLPTENISATLQKQFERYGRKVGNIIQLPCVLLAQWSKNFASPATVINGADLMKHVTNVLRQIQRLVGGGFVSLECEAEKTRLVEHYEQIGFVSVSERMSSEGKPLLQLIKKI